MNTNYTGNPIPHSHWNLPKSKLQGEMVHSILFEVLMKRLAAQKHWVGSWQCELWAEGGGRLCLCTCVCRWVVFGSREWSLGICCFVAIIVGVLLTCCSLPQCFSKLGHCVSTRKRLISQLGIWSEFQRKLSSCSRPDSLNLVYLC